MTPAGLPSPVLALLVISLLVRAAVSAWIHPSYREYRAERRAARLNSRKDMA